MSEKKESINIEKIALRKIRKYDKTLIQKIYNDEEEDKYRKIIVMTTKSGENDQLQFFLRTKGCSMKRAGSCWNCNYGMMRKCNIKKEEYISEFEKILDKYDEYESVLIGAYGSVTDEIELDQTIFIEILKIALNKSRIKDIVIETHITKISPKLIEEIYILNKRKKNIEFNVGVEDIEPENRKLINKIGVDNFDLIDIYNLLEKYNMNININIIYGLPFMNENERIESTYNSIRNISKMMPKAKVIIFLMSIKEHTILEEMYVRGLYKLPNPWGFVYTSKKIFESDDINTITLYSWFGEKGNMIKETTCYNCKDCETKIIKTFKILSSELEKKERNKIIDDLLNYGEQAKCDCLKKLKNELNINDGKNSKIRYHEFLNKVYNGLFDI